MCGGRVTLDRGAGCSGMEGSKYSEGQVGQVVLVWGGVSWQRVQLRKSEVGQAISRANTSSGPEVMVTCGVGEG